MTDPYDWQMARRIARLAAHSDGHGLRRGQLAEALAADLAGSGRDLGDWAMLAYSRKWVDCIGDFIVASATDIRAAPRPVPPPTAPEPPPPLRLV
jgi:hypothetical protein